MGQAQNLRFVHVFDEPVCAANCRCPRLYDGDRPQQFAYAAPGY